MLPTKKLSLLILCVLSFSYIKAQTQKFGKIDKEQLEMKSYEKDPAANAVVLFDEGRSNLTFTSAGDPQMVFTQHKRIKIFNKNGYDQANISIVYYSPEGGSSGSENVRSLKAYTYTLANGEVTKTKMEKDAIFEERINEYYVKKKFTLPNIEEGAVIEYTYDIYSDDFTDLRNWYFQSDIPTIWSTYETMIPDQLTYKPSAWGYADISKQPEKKQNSGSLVIAVNQWYGRDIPAFKPEKHIATPKDYLSRVEFQLVGYMGSNGVYQDLSLKWTKIVGSLMSRDSFGNQLRKRGVVKDVVDEIVTSNQSPEQKAKIIYNYVVKNIRWNEYYGFSTQKGVRKTFNDKEGNVGDINMLLTLLLKEAGLEANPVLLSTRSHGKIVEFYPRYGAFNYVVSSVKLGDEIFYLDASQKNLPFGGLSYECHNGQGLLIDGDREGVIKWVEMTSATSSLVNTLYTLELNEKGEVTGHANRKISGLDAVMLREEASGKSKEEYLKEFWGEDELLMSNFKAAHLDDKEQYVEMSFDIESIESGQSEVIYFNPFLEKVYKENPFKIEDRKYPVDFGYASQMVYTFSFKIPENYTVESIPQSTNLVTPDKSVVYSQAIANQYGTISIRVRFMINKPVFSAEEYPQLKEMINRILEKQAEQIILKKKA